MILGTSRVQTPFGHTHDHDRDLVVVFRIMCCVAICPSTLMRSHLTSKYYCILVVVVVFNVVAVNTITNLASSMGVDWLFDCAGC